MKVYLRDNCMKKFCLICILMIIIKPIGDGHDEYSMACAYLILMYMQQKAWYIRKDIKTDISSTVLCSLLSGLPDNNNLYQEEIELLCLICEALMPHTPGELENSKAIKCIHIENPCPSGQL